MYIEREPKVRKKNRLSGYDYSSAGCYFITICVKDGHEILADIDVGANCVRPSLSGAGAVIESQIHALSEIYEHIYVDKFVIMPNHIHLMIAIINDEPTQFAPTISRIIKQFKGSITKKIGFSLWQRSFHDHVIRNEAEYRQIWQYIDENPARWREDRYYVQM